MCNPCGNSDRNSSADAAFASRTKRAFRSALASFLLGIVHDRRLMSEAQVNIAIRWFASFGLTAEQIAAVFACTKENKPRNNLYIAPTALS